ncbi:MAG: hypothetical protein Q8L98_07715 [Chlamydiales bacterium]|nr:hypothetical protein [Chlamydiales bacterium]
MDDKANDLVDVFLSIFVNDHIEPSKDWLDLPVKELNRQLEDSKQKHTQSCISEKDRRRKAIVVDGLYINALLTLVQGKYFLERGTYLEYKTYGNTTLRKPASEISGQSPSSFEEGAESVHAKSLDELSPWQEEYLIHLTTFSPSMLDLKKDIENGAEEPGKMLVLCNYWAITKWDRRHIKWQAAAQVFWLDIKANAKEVSKKLFSSEELVDLLDLWANPNIDKPPNGEEVEFRNLENVVRIVNPRGVKRGRPREDAIALQYPVFIPLVFDVDLRQLNLEGLQIAIFVMVKIMKMQGKPQQEIANHPLIFQYKSLTLSHPFFKGIVDEWVKSAFKD